MMNLSNKLSTLLLCLALITPSFSVTPNGEAFKFTAKAWTRQFFKPRAYSHPGDSFIFDCSTNDPEATVTLQRAELRGGSLYKDALTDFGNRITVMPGKQKFSLGNVIEEDYANYRCKAVDQSNKEILLTLGRLIVNKVPRTIEPEIIPQEAVYKIETNGNDKISCKAQGAIGVSESYLNWYREDSSGQRTLLSGDRVERKEETTTTAYIDVEVLLFKNFQKADIGKYVCVRKVLNNPATEKSITIELEENVSPKITLPNNPNGIQIANIGDQIFLSCDVTGSPKPKKYWRRNGVNIHDCPNTQEPRCTYTIRKTSFPENNGIYECVGENIVMKNAKELRVEVQVPPKLKKPTTTIVANTKEDRELLCELSEGNPLPTFKWEQQAHSCTTDDCDPLDDQWKPVSQQYPPASTTTKESSTIATATTATFFYRCSITNNAGSDQHVITVYRKEEAVPQFFIESNANVINRDDELSVKCVADLYIYKDITIKRNGDEIQGLQALEANQTRVKSLSKKAALADNGDYTCVGSLKRGGQKTKELKIKINEITKPVIVSLKDITVSQDAKNNQILTCQVTGNPRPEIKWSKGNKALTSLDIADESSCDRLVSGIYRMTSQPNALVICSLDYQQHAGSYECTASNKLGSVKQTMKLTITAKPRIVNWFNETVIGVIEDEKENPALTCTAEGYPTPKVIWRRNSSSVLAEGSGEAVYQIVNIDAETAGKYECFAENTMGSDLKIKSVLVLGQSPAAATNFIENKTTLTGIIVAFVAVLIIIFILVLLYKRHLKKQYALFLEPNKNFVIDPNKTLFDQSSELPYDMVWEFPRERVTLGENLGSGAFGVVKMAEAEGIAGFRPRDNSAQAKKRRKAIQKSRRYHQIKDKKEINGGYKQSNIDTVAVKTLKDETSESEYKDLASELKILIHLGEHKNIVNLLGACTTGNAKLLVILEYCSNGNLLSYLRERREIFQPQWSPRSKDVSVTFTYTDLVHIACQISDGMEFLQAKKCVHRDLAARNILVDENHNMKIADFGLARDIYKDEFYLKNTTGLLPIKWMAPESLFDRVFTTSSDVWSFGILLWETFTLGGSPYPGLPTDDLYGYLENGGRMKRPDICPKDVYSVMMECWEKSPYRRPMFSQISTKLNYILTNHVPNGSYMDMTQAQNALSTTPDEETEEDQPQDTTTKPLLEDTDDHNSDNKSTSNTNEDKKSSLSRADSFNSTEYLEAMSNGKTPQKYGKVASDGEDDDDYVDPLNSTSIFNSPKGETYVPPPDDSEYENSNIGSPKTPLLSTNDYGDDNEYIPMTPADHYQNPTSFSYNGLEAVV
eukprot:TCONS_00054849-protein